MGEHQCVSNPPMPEIREHCPWLAAVRLVDHGFSPSSDNLRQSCVELSSEWQAFVGHRVQEDLHLLQEFASAEASAEMGSAYCRFCQKAVEDYPAAYGQMIKLGTDFIKGGAMIYRSAVESPRQQSKVA